MDQEHLVNINLASKEELIEIPGLGPSYAERILELRPFESLAELTQIRGISANKVDELRAYLTTQSIPEEAQPQDAEPVEAPLSDVVDGQVMELSEVEEAVVLTEPVEQPIEAEPVKEPEPVYAAPVEPTAPAAQPQTSQPQAAERPKESPRQSPEIAQAEKSQSGGVSRNELILYSAGFAVISIILAVILSLGILGVVNASLNYPTEAQFITLQRSFEDLSSQTTVLQQDVASLRTRMDNLETLSGRVSDLEKQTGELAATLDQTNQQLTQIGEQVQQLDERTAKLESDVAKFTQFLDGLRGLLNELLAEPVVK